MSQARDERSALSSAQADESGWARLLALLAPEPKAAARRYDELRGTLINMFRWRGLSAPSDLADETLHRVSKQLAEGRQIEASIAAYVAGVARLVALEARRGEKKAFALAETVHLHVPVAMDDDDPVTDARAECARTCFDTLPSEQRTLLTRYHAGRGKERIAERQRMASDLSLAPNALRIRMFRLREQLDACLQDCAKRAVAS